MTAIVAWGRWLPRARLGNDAIREATGTEPSDGISSRTVAHADEDVLTMAAAAVNDLLDRTDYSRGEIQGVHLGTTTPPTQIGDLTADLIEMCHLEDVNFLTTATRSARAGTAAILSASHGPLPAIAVASDAIRAAPLSELGLAAGAGACALLLAPEGPVRITETTTVTQPHPGYRVQSPENPERSRYAATEFERVGYTQTVERALQSITNEPGTIVPTAPNGKYPARLETRSPQQEVIHTAQEFGDTGAASAGLGVLRAWEQGVEELICVGVGAGTIADAIVLEGALDVEAPPAGKEISFHRALQLRGQLSSQGAIH